MGGLTELQKAVQNEMNRILDIIETEQERGFSFTKLPSLNFDPTKARTKQLKMLRRYTRQKLMEQHSEWIDPETGEIYTGREGLNAQFDYRQRKLESYHDDYNKVTHKPVVRLPGSVDISIIDNIRQKLLDLPTEKRAKGGLMNMEEEKNAVLSAFDDMIGQAENDFDLVQYLYENEYEISLNCDRIEHASEQYDTYDSFYKLIIIFNRGQALTSEQATQYEEEFADGLEEYDYDD